MSGAIRDGRRAGGCPYGYAVVLGRPGELCVVDDHANIVRRIFDEYLRGISPKIICERLNKEKVPPPRGKFWAPNSLVGRKSRADGILRNQMYIGRITWNRTTKFKNPETGRRVQRENPQSEWQTSEASHLAIIDRATFHEVQSMLESFREKPLAGRRRPKHLLSGILRCGTCGGGMGSVGTDKSGKTRVQCSIYHNSRSCSHTRKYYAASIIEVVIKGIHGKLQHPEAIKVFLQEYMEERNRLNRQKALGASRLRNDLAEVERRIANLVKALAEGFTSAASVRDALATLEAQKLELSSHLAYNPGDLDVISLHPAATRRYLDLIGQLNAGKEIVLGGESAAAFREIVETVTVYDSGLKGKLDVEVKSRLSSLIDRPVPPFGRFVGGYAGAG